MLVRHAESHANLAFEQIKQTKANNANFDQDIRDMKLNLDLQDSRLSPLGKEQITKQQSVINKVKLHR